MIRCKSITKVYTINDNEFVNALTDVNISFLDAGMTFLLGESGSGKSTLLNILGGLDDPTRGEVVFFGNSLSLLSEEQMDSFRESCVGFVFQELNLIEELNVEENITIGYSILDKKDKVNNISNILSKVGLRGYEKRKVNELSGGQKERVAIARALIKNPKVILCDEPTGSLDKDNSNKIFDLLNYLSKDYLVIVASHDIQSAYTYGYRIITLVDRIIKSDLTKEKESKLNKDLTINDNKIVIPKGYKISEEETKEIINFLRNPNESRTIAFRSNYSITKEVFNTEVKESINFEKSSFKFKTAIKLGISFLKQHLSKVLITSFLMLTCLTFFCLAFTAFFYNL